MTTLPSPFRPAALAAAAYLADLLAADAAAGSFSSLATRSRVVQVCVGVMAVGLFILMKKFAPGAAGRHSRRT